MRSPNVWSAAMKNQTASLKIASPIAAEVERIRQLPLPPPRRTGPSSLDSHDRPSSSAPSSFIPSANPHRPRIKEVGRLPQNHIPIPKFPDSQFRQSPKILLKQPAPTSSATIPSKHSPHQYAPSLNRTLPHPNRLTRHHALPQFQNVFCAFLRGQNMFSAPLRIPRGQKGVEVLRVPPCPPWTKRC